MERLMEVKEVAARLGISVRGVWRHLAAGKLPKPVKVVGLTKWYESDVNAVFEKLKRTGGLQPVN